MNYEVLLSDGGQLYLIRRDDGQYGLVNTTMGIVEWNENPDHFLRFLFLNPQEGPLEPEKKADIDALLEGKTYPPVENMGEKVQQMLRDLGFVPVEENKEKP